MNREVDKTSEVAKKKTLGLQKRNCLIILISIGARCTDDQYEYKRRNGLEIELG